MTNTIAAMRQWLDSFGLVIVFGLIYVFSPLIETEFFPVVTRLSVTGHNDVSGGVEAQGWAMKLRDCDYRAIQVYLGERPNGVPLRYAEFRDPPTIREPGLLEWQRLYVPLPWSLAATNTYADVLHSCYGDERILTRSRFWR